MTDAMIVLFAVVMAIFNGAVQLSSHRSPSPSIPTVEFCGVINNPGRYDNRVFRIRAILVENQTPRVDGADPILYDLGCRNSDFTVVVEWSESFNQDAAANWALQKIRDKPDKLGNTRAVVTLVGHFNASGKRKYGHLDWADSQFVIQSIEKVSTIPASASWPNRFGK